MRFRFIGDPSFAGEGPNEVTLFGLSFNRKDWTEVADAEAARRLLKHSHFEVDPASRSDSGIEPVRPEPKRGPVPPPKRKGRPRKVLVGTGVVISPPES